MNKKCLVIVSVITVLVLSTLIAQADIFPPEGPSIMGADCERILSSNLNNVKTKATTWVDTTQTLYAYGTTSALICVNDQVASGATHPWDGFISYQNIETGWAQLTDGDIYYGESTHAVGTAFEFVTDSAESSFGPYYFNAASRSTTTIDLSREATSNLYNRIKRTGDSIAAKFNLNTEDLTYRNVLDKAFKNKYFDKMDTLNSSFKIIYHKLLSTLKEGDYVPSIWIDYESNLVYMGWKKANGQAVLHTLHWKDSIKNSKASKK